MILGGQKGCCWSVAVVGGGGVGGAWFRGASDRKIPKLFHKQSAAMVRGRVVMLCSIVNAMSRASQDLVFRSDEGVLAASYSKGRLPSTVGALWSGRACDPPCVVGIENEGIAFVWLPGGSVR